jgi:hypothetical protein
MTKTEMIALEAVKFYAAKFHIGVKDVLWALEMGNDKVAKDLSKLIAVGILAANRR